MKKLFSLTLACLLLFSLSACGREPKEEVSDEKPVIYLYPEQETDVRVTLDLAGELTCAYPAYGDGWSVRAAPDGTLTDESGQTYRYLYWEGTSGTDYDFSTGFCVSGEDTAAFLEDALARLGLTRAEANEFIIYWLPQMQDNAYNLISFQQDVYTDSAKLTVDPVPDTLLRVFMAWQPSEKFVDLPAQELSGERELIAAYDAMLAREGDERAHLQARMPEYTAGGERLIADILALGGKSR